MSDIKVRLGSMKNITRTLSEDERKLQEELNNMMQQINELKDVWQGEEANRFYEKAEQYIQFLNFLPTTYHNLAEIMKDANKKYKEIDTFYSDEIKRAVVRHE